MIHYVDVSGSMRDQDLIQVAQIIVNCALSGDSVYAIAYDPEKLSLTRNLEHQLLNSSVRGSGFVLDRYDGLLKSNHKLDVNNTLYTDDVFSNVHYHHTNFRFQNVFVVPACPVCLCSCPDGINIHINSSEDVLHNVYSVHNV